MTEYVRAAECGMHLRADAYHRYGKTEKTLSYVPSEVNGFVRAGECVRRANRSAGRAKGPRAVGKGVDKPAKADINVTH